MAAFGAILNPLLIVYLLHSVYRRIRDKIIYTNMQKRPFFKSGLVLLFYLTTLI